jgi:hypothetical protein
MMLPRRCLPPSARPARPRAPGRPLVCLALATASLVTAAAADAGSEFERDVRPILREFCYDCHGDGAKKGNVAFDELKAGDTLLGHELWLKVLKNTRAGLMPPHAKPRPSAPQQRKLEHWILASAFGLDPHNPDPGRVTVRRLNRVEYRNTIRDLLGIEFDTDREFPPDDAGYGFDNIGDVLTLPPMLLEKYLAAARTVVAKAVPLVPGAPAERLITGRDFTGAGSRASSTPNRGQGPAASLALPYYDAASVSNVFTAEHAGAYRLLLDFSANEKFVDNQFDYNKCRLVFKADGRALHTQDLAREGGRSFHHEFDLDWPAGQHQLVLEVQPLTPGEKQVRSLTVRLESVTVRGPLAEQYWVRPANHERFFPHPTPPDAAGRRSRARELLEALVRRAYRRPADAATLDRLVALAEAGWQPQGKTFEAGIAQAMTAVLASPRFLFREEATEEAPPGRHPLVDEFALASRLSYFLWSSTPDDTLLALAGKHQLRKNLAAQTRRMLADGKSEALVRNFVGQWLQTRDVDSVQVDARQVLQRESAPDPAQERRRQRFRELRHKPEETLTAAEKKEMEELRGSLFRPSGRPLRAELTSDLRRAMRSETEKVFEYVLRQDRTLLELLDSDYTFLNERLARHYGLTNLNVTGDDLRLVKLPADRVRGGVLTHGSFLAVTSNPTRTSPVKRGLFILDNLLGTPPPPPPPDIPPLEDAAKAVKERTPTLRETLALHREQPLCSSCHNRMDPLGLAFENFNAMGMWRDQERGQPIDAAGTLLTGESFTNVTQLKRILATGHALEFYRTLTGKLLTYALGRGLEYYDVAAVDAIVERLAAANGRPSALLAGIIDSAPFQRSRAASAAENSQSSDSRTQRADARPSP